MTLWKCDCSKTHTLFSSFGIFTLHPYSKSSISIWLKSEQFPYFNLVWEFYKMNDCQWTFYLIIQNLIGIFIKFFLGFRLWWCLFQLELSIDRVSLIRFYIYIFFGVLRFSNNSNLYFVCNLLPVRAKRLITNVIDFSIL